MIWVTADPHFYHQNIIEYTQRFDPKTGELFKRVEDMNNMLEECWNRVVGTTDTVYIIGDLGWVSRDRLGMGRILKRVKGSKILIMGNHDHETNHWYTENGIAKVEPDYVILDDDMGRCMLSHYPFFPDKYDRQKVIDIKDRHKKVFDDNACVFHYYGHTHRPPVSNDWSCNVGVDLHDFYPIKFGKYWKF